jgi:hypothetical protein
VANTISPNRPRLAFDADTVYSPAEIAATLKATPRAVRQWVYDGLIADDGVIRLPRGLRVYGWALNDFLAER